MVNRPARAARQRLAGDDEVVIAQTVLPPNMILIFTIDPGANISRTWHPTATWSGLGGAPVGPEIMMTSLTSSLRPAIRYSPGMTAVALVVPGLRFQ